MKGIVSEVAGWYVCLLLKGDVIRENESGNMCRRGMTMISNENVGHAHHESDLSALDHLCAPENGRASDYDRPAHIIKHALSWAHCTMLVKNVHDDGVHPLQTSQIG